MPDTIQVTCSNISWDTEDEKVDLPTKTTVELPADWTEADDNGQVANALSNKFGWCVFGFSID